MKLEDKYDSKSVPQEETGVAFGIAQTSCATSIQGSRVLRAYNPVSQWRLLHC